MKKTYQNPLTKIVRIEAARMIAASSESMGFGKSVTSASGADSRRRNDAWDDEEEY